MLLLISRAFPQASPSAQAPAEAEVQQGTEAFQRGDFGAAEQHFLAALKMDPNLPKGAEVRANLGLAYYVDHQYPKAISEFQEALRQDASLQTANSFLPLSLAASGDCAQAIPGLDREFASNPDVKLRRVLGLSLEKCWSDAGRQMEADVAMQKLLAAYPDDPDVLYTAGQLYGRLSSEINLKLLQVAPASPRTYQLMGSVAAADGNWKGAIDAYRKALHLEPNLQGAHLQIAVLLLTNSTEPNAWHEAITELNEELKLNPTSAEAEYEIGEAYRKHQQPEPAVKAFEQALELDPNAVPVRLGLAKALRELGRKPEALAALEPALKSAPGDPAIHFLLAQIYRDLGRTNEAQAETAAFERLQKTTTVPGADLGPK
ncbi:MAG TPA: tetratricopeptide repeat protein [Terriglobia bacterium]